MPDNVCQRCQTPLQPSEHGLCVPCTRCVWQDVWPGMRVVMNRVLPADERATLADLAAGACLDARWLINVWAKKHNVRADLVAGQSWGWLCNASMGGLASSIPLHDQVEAASDGWRTWITQQEESRRLGDTMSPPEHLAVLMYLSVAIRRLARRYVRRHFDFDVHRQRFVRRSAGLQRTHAGEISFSMAQVDTLVVICQYYVLCERVLQAGLEALWRSPREGKEPTIRGMQDAVEAMLTIRQSVPPLLFGPLMESPLMHQEEYGTQAIVGWVATHISLHSNPRLRRALAEDDSAVTQAAMSPWTTLLERLLANVYLAWHAGGWTTLEKLRTRIASLMEDDGSEWKSQEDLINEPSQAAPQTLTDSTYETVVRKLEEEALYTARFRQAKLTPYEEAVAQLQLQDYSDQEIADMLNRSLNGIQQAWLRARKKLGQVMGS